MGRGERRRRGEWREAQDPGNEKLQKMGKKRRRPTSNPCAFANRHEWELGSPSAHRDWENGLLASGTGYNTNFLWLSLLRRTP